MTGFGVSLVDDFDSALAACLSGEELRVLLCSALRELGFDYFALLHHASLVTAPGWLIRLDNYPGSWVAEVNTGGLAVDDPVHLASGRSNSGFCWDDIGALVRLTPRHRDILERSGRHGIGPGFTVPANVPGEPGGSCSFAVRRGRTLPDSRLHAAEVIGAHAFRAARRLHGYPATRARPHLSPREQQCLRLVARGKTDWEIGRLLGISEATARQYVKRARAAYDVVSRTQLVVHGLRDAWIGFDEAIPPHGGMG
jgi:LuxR family transcriptional regulator, quorum-sensing system regulator CciR